MISLEDMKKILFSSYLLGLGILTLGAQDLLTFAGYHNQLHGYTDRYCLMRPTSVSRRAVS